jgi:carbon-monoxide dehydrogenase medium subunit
VPRYDGWGCHYEKFARMAQSWATVGVAVAVRVDDGTIAAARVALSGMGPYPVRAREVEEALVGEPTDRVTAAAEAAGDAAAPRSDPAGSARYRRHLARVLTTRAVVAACAGAPNQP